MRGIIADVNLEGPVQNLVETFFRSKEWSEFWAKLGLSNLVFADVGLHRRAKDNVVWQTCQDNDLILITGNRNDDDPTSLEATIRDRLRPDSLPVITVAQPKSLGVSASYTAEVGIRILEILYDIDDYRGTGRIYAP